jgi:crossover junction endodeoxyribonuclease RusA
MMRPITFFVEGKPQPAGSKRAFVIRGTNRAIVTDANPKARDWKIDVQHAARAIVDEMDGNLLRGPLVLSVTFFLVRPKSHYRTGKNWNTLRDNAPEYPIGKPDVLKLARGLEDALTSLVWADDAQIVTECLKKRYARNDEMQGAEVTIAEAEPTPTP